MASAMCFCFLSQITGLLNPLVQSTGGSEIAFSAQAAKVISLLAACP
jgi:hypothetical protein